MNLPAPPNSGAMLPYLSLQACGGLEEWLQAYMDQSTHSAPFLECPSEYWLCPAGTRRSQGEGTGSARATPPRSAPEDPKRKAETLSLKTSGVGCLVKELWPEVLPSMLQALRDHNAVLCDHPHSRDYSLLEVRS